MPRQKAASLTIQWRIFQKINYKYKNSSEQRNDVMKKMGGTLPSAGMWQGEVFAISDCLVLNCGNRIG